MVSIVALMIFGLVVGLIAELILPGRGVTNLLAFLIVGAIGAMAGTWLGRSAHFFGPDDPANFVVAVLGSVVLLAAYGLTARGAAKRHKPIAG